MSQHPSYDANVEFCHDLPDLEKKRHAKFGNRRAINNFGVGRISVMTSNGDKVIIFIVLFTVEKPILIGGQVEAHSHSSLNFLH